VTANEHALTDEGYLRIAQVLAVFPVSRSLWWEGVADGRFPKPVKLEGRITAWRVRDIRELLRRYDTEADANCSASDARAAR